MTEGTDTTIVYVEDNEDNALLVRRLLEAEGYNVHIARDSNEALVLLGLETPPGEYYGNSFSSDRVDLILMDINLPEPSVDGYTLTAMLRDTKEYQNHPIIAVTANVMRGDRERALEAGCNNYIRKPDDILTLPDVVERYLSRSDG